MNGKTKALGLLLLFFVSLILVSGEVMAVRQNQRKGDHIVFFPDPKLDHAIRIALHLDNEHDISVGDLQGLTTLSATTLGIQDLSGLEYCTNLKKLVLSNNRISCIDQISALKNLSYLRLDGNLVECIRPLLDLDDLNTLNLNINLISDASPLEGATSLGVLELSQNRISDLAFLRNLSNLTKLNLGHNRIRTLPEDIFRNKPKLKDLNLTNNAIDDISSLRVLAGDTMRFLRLGQNRIVAFDVLCSFKKLDHLSLNSMKPHINDLKQIFNPEGNEGGPCLNTLSELDVSSNSISNLKSLENHRSILRLKLAANFIEDIRPLGSLKTLDQLGLQNNFIEDITPLYSLSENLSQLHLSGNPLDEEDLSGLHRFRNLKLIALGYMRPKLRTLHFLSKVKKPSRFDLEDNLIYDLTPIMGTIDAGDTLNLLRNPLGDLGCDQVRILRDKGVHFEGTNCPN